MTAEVLRIFSHEFNALEVARQEYRLAKEHFREVMLYRDSTSAADRQRFTDAIERQAAARDRFVAELCR